MKLEQIRQAIEVYNTGSINRAAQSLYLAQSSLSSSIKSLERELGHDIFVRSQSGISLTSFGVEFIAHGREILKHMAAIEQYIDRDCEQPLSLSVAVYYLFFASRLFTDLCNRYHEEPIALNYVEDARSAVVTSVAEEQCEIGLLTMPDLKKSQWSGMIHDMGLEYVRIYTGAPYIMMGPHCPLHDDTQAEVNMAQLSSLPIITYAEPHPLFAALDEEVFHRVQPGNFITVSDRGTMIHLLSQTSAVHLGVFHPSASFDSDFFPGIQRRRVRDAGFMLEIGYLKKRGHTLGLLAREYLQSVQDLLAK